MNECWLQKPKNGQDKSQYFNINRLTMLRIYYKVSVPKYT